MQQSEPSYSNTTRLAILPNYVRPEISPTLIPDRPLDAERKPQRRSLQNDVNPAAQANVPKRRRPPAAYKSCAHPHAQYLFPLGPAGNPTLLPAPGPLGRPGALCLGAVYSGSLLDHGLDAPMYGFSPPPP